jgi:hypothetical protein
MQSRVNVVGLMIEGDSRFTSLGYSYRAIVSVTTKWPHADVADVASIVDGAFWEASGIKPIVTLGENSQLRPSQPQGFPWTSAAVLVVGALVLVIWAKP